MSRFLNPSQSPLNPYGDGVDLSQERHGATGQTGPTSQGGHITHPEYPKLYGATSWSSVHNLKADYSKY